METRRGRPRREDQRQDRLRQVMALFRREHTVLEECQAFDECPGAQQVLSIVMRQLPRAVYKKGTALDLLIQGAALDVMGDRYAAERSHDEKLAQFIQAYFFEERTLVDITTTVLGLSDRSNVRNIYQAQAFTLIARRFLALVEHDDPLSLSAGVKEALEWQEQRWDHAARRMTDALLQLNVRRFGAVPARLAVGSPADRRAGSMPSAPASSAIDQQRPD